MSKRKLCEYLSDLNVSNNKKPKVNQRTIECQTDIIINENYTKVYSESEMNDIINKTKTEMISNYYQFMKSSNIVEKIIHSHKCEL